MYLVELWSASFAQLIRTIDQLVQVCMCIKVHMQGIIHALVGVHVTVRTASFFYNLSICYSMKWQLDLPPESQLHGIIYTRVGH